jgi:hypothetical protein
VKAYFFRQRTKTSVRLRSRAPAGGDKLPTRPPVASAYRPANYINVAESSRRIVSLNRKAFRRPSSARRVATVAKTERHERRNRCMDRKVNRYSTLYPYVMCTFHLLRNHRVTRGGSSICLRSEDFIGEAIYTAIYKLIVGVYVEVS